MFVISLDQIKEYESIYMRYQENNVGVISDKVQKFMSESSLPKPTLSKIWYLFLWII